MAAQKRNREVLEKDPGDFQRKVFIGGTDNYKQ